MFLYYYLPYSASTVQACTPPPPSQARLWTDPGVSGINPDVSTVQAIDVDPMLVQCWASAVDYGQIIMQHSVSVLGFIYCKERPHTAILHPLPAREHK